MRHTYALLMAALLLASCGGNKTQNKDAELTQLKKERAALDEKIKKIESAIPDTGRKPVAVAIRELQTQDFDAYIEVQSQISGDENVLATPQAPGTVKTVNVHSGQKVSQGQVLATLDASSVEQQIAAQDAQLALSKSLYERQQKLWGQNIGTEVQFLQAKAQYQAMQKQRDALVAQRNMYRIVSPISGTVDVVSLKVGDVAQPGMTGIRVISYEKLKAEANLGENYLGKVKTGDPVILVFPDLNDSIRTRLTYVAQAVDPISRAFQVMVRLGNNKKLTPNMSCRMRIANYNNSSALIVPVSVLQKTAAGEMLYVVDGDKAKSVIVTTGRNSNGQVEVLSGLKPGDKLIVEGFEELDNGQRIQIVK